MYVTSAELEELQRSKRGNAIGYEIHSRRLSRSMLTFTFTRLVLIAVMMCVEGADGFGSRTCECDCECEYVGSDHWCVVRLSFFSFFFLFPLMNVLPAPFSQVHVTVMGAAQGMWIAPRRQVIRIAVTSVGVEPHATHII